MLCCDVLTENVFEAGRKGFSIIPYRINNSYHFLLQFRSNDYSEVNVIGIVNERGIGFCPWCGSNLKHVADIHEDELRNLSKAKAHLLLNYF